MVKPCRKLRKPIVAGLIIKTGKFIYRAVRFVYWCIRIVEFFQDFDWPPFP